MRPGSVSLTGSRVLLRPLKASDVGPAYLGWLRDPRVNRYLESRFQRHTLASLRAFVASASRDPGTLLLAIVRKDSGRHIGNIKLGPIDRRHRRADIGILVGDRASWGKGFATEAIEVLASHALKTLGLHKVTAGIYDNNPGSIRAFRKAGFIVEARRRKHYLCGGRWRDGLLMARFR